MQTQVVGRSIMLHGPDIAAQGSWSLTSVGRQVLGDRQLDAAVVVDGEVVLHHALAERLLAHQLRPGEASTVQ